MNTITITRPISLPTLRTMATKYAKPTPYRTLPEGSLFCDALQVIATSDSPPMDYLTRVHGITADEVRFLSRLGLVSVSDNRVYVTDSGLSELR